MLELVDVHQEFAGDPPVQALRGVSLRIERGEFVAIEGPSGSGKSTLLNDLALLHIPSRGDYLIEGASLARAKEGTRSAIRSRMFGFVFQSFHLLDRRPVVDSVELGMLYRAVPRAERRLRAMDALREVGLEHKASQIAAKLSGGERQRVAVARALAAQAPLIIADEPTGNLDSTNGAAIVRLLREVADHGRTVVLVTHDPGVAAVAERRIRLRDGQVVSDEPTTSSGTTAPIETVFPSSPEPSAAEQFSVVPASSAQAAAPPGRDSTLRAIDMVRDALASLRARARKSATLVAAVAVGVSLAVTTLGISESASAQVSDRFDAVLNTEVDVSRPSGLSPDPYVPTDSEAIDAALLDLAGVVGVGSLTSHGEHDITVQGRSAVRPAPVFAMTAGLLRSGRIEVDRGGVAAEQMRPGAVLLGRLAADDLDIGPLALEPVITVDGLDQVVVGLIEQSPRAPELLGGVLMVSEDAVRHGEAGEQRWLITTAAGAAPTVAGQAPLVLRPTAPQELSISAPADPQDLRARVQSDLRMTLTVLSLVVLLASMVGLANSMMLAVVERSPEFGLRRALGARPRHIVQVVITESAVIGCTGGVAGLGVGLAAILGVTLANRWVPVFDLSLAPLAVGGGVLVGVLSGVVAAVRAGRVQPADALRSNG